MTDLKTNPKLLHALRRATERAISEDELRNQRVSYVLGFLKETNTVTREKIERMLAEQEGRAAHS